jgi:hypothetical protein
MTQPVIGVLGVAGGDVPGRSTLEAGGVLLAYALGVTVVALWAFHSRDAA